MKSYEPETALGRAVHSLEETAIAVLLGLMTVITFVNVILRYVFNDSLIWGLEVTEYLFAWLVLFGVSYGVKTTAHLGVDALINVVPGPVRRGMALAAAGACVAYAFMLVKGGWDFFANFANLPRTEGRVIPTGLQEMKPWDARGYTPTEQIPLPEFMRAPLEALLLYEGDDPFEKLPIVIPYLIIPVATALLLFRFCQAFWRIWTGRTDRLIVSHEAEDAVADIEAGRAR